MKLQARFRKRAQTQFILYFIVILFTVILVILLYKVIAGFGEKERAAISVEMTTKIKSTVDVLSSEEGSRDQQKIRVPSGTDKVCFIDLEKREEIIDKRPPIMEKYLVIAESLESGSQDNMFLINEGEVASSDYVGKICIDEYPYYLCRDAEQGMVDISLEGTGSCTAFYKEPSCIVVRSNFGEEQAIASYNARLSIQPFTEISGSPFELCIRTEEGGNAISEKYSFTPESVSLSKPGLITINYDKDLVGERTSESNIVVKYFGTENALETKSVDMTKGAVTSSITALAPVAVYNKMGPTAVIGGVSDGAIFWINQPAQFDGALSFDPNGNIKNYKWDFGDGTTSLEPRSSHAYTEPGHYTVSLTVEDSEENSDTESIKVIVNSNNKRNLEKYALNPVFIIADTKSSNNMVKGVTLSMWNDNEGGRNTYPFVIYHKEQGIDTSDFLYLLSSYSSYIVAISEIPPELSGIAELVDNSNYFEYWTGYDDVVVIDLLNTDGVLMAGLFSSFINAPLLYSNGPSIDISKIVGKKIYCIGISESLCSSWVSPTKAKTKKIYNVDDLRNPSINPYAKLYGTIRLG